MAERNKGKTIVVDATGDLYVGKMNPTQSRTAHAGVVKEYGVEEPVVGGSIKANGSIVFKSETINNDTLGMCDVTDAMEKLGLDTVVREKLVRGDYKGAGKSCLNDKCDWKAMTNCTVCDQHRCTNTVRGGRCRKPKAGRSRFCEDCDDRDRHDGDDGDEWNDSDGEEWDDSDGDEWDD